MSDSLYQASALEELTIRRGEKVEVIDDSRKWWKVKNRFGSEGFVPSNLLEVVIYKKKSLSKFILLEQKFVPCI